MTRTRTLMLLVGLLAVACLGLRTLVVAAVVVPLLTTLLAAELDRSGGILARMVIRLAVRIAPPAERERCEIAWLDDIACAGEAGLTPLLTALGILALAAPRIGWRGFLRSTVSLIAAVTVASVFMYGLAWGLRAAGPVRAASWMYLNSHFVVTVGALVFIYLRRNDSFYFVRNMFIVAMGFALVGYALYPTAPPHLRPAWGFTDSVTVLTGVHIGSKPVSALLNLYAALPSMHVCFALIIAWPLARLVRRRALKLAWFLYPFAVTTVVIAESGSYLADASLGVLTATTSALLAARLLARLRPQTWSLP